MTQRTTNTSQTAGVTAPEGQPSLALVAADQADERTATRWRRAGIAVATVAPSALAAPVAGVLYLAPAERVAGEAMHATLAGGAHLCLLPPWPSTPVARAPGSGAATLALAPALDRSGVALAAALARAERDTIGDTIGGTAGDTPAPQVLRILYRDQVLGALGQALATTRAGEVVLATLPRTSNRHGQLLATTLLLGLPSAQTVLADVAALLDALLAWLGRVPVDHAPPGAAAPPAAEPDAADDERWARIALLALALALPSEVNGDQAITLSPERHATIHTAFDEVAHRLGQRAAVDGAFAAGWRVLVALGVVTANPIAVRPAALRDYLGRWQLAARLRRLRQPATGE